jgi:hypothetical protein
VKGLVSHPLAKNANGWGTLAGSCGGAMLKRRNLREPDCVSGEENNIGFGVFFEHGRDQTGLHSVNKSIHSETR